MICWYPDYCHDNAFERLHSKEFSGSPDADGAGGCRCSFPFRLRRRGERGRREIRDASRNSCSPRYRNWRPHQACRARFALGEWRDTGAWPGCDGWLCGAQFICGFLRLREAVRGLCYTKANNMLLARGIMNSRCLNNLCSKVDEL